MYSDPEAQAEWEALGLGPVPCAVQGDRRLLILHNDQLRDFLGLPPEDLGASYQELVAAMNRALEAVERAVLQVPPERLSDPTPNRGRDLRELVYNIHDRITPMRNALDTGIYERERGNDYEFSRHFRTAQELARYCSEIRVPWFQRARLVDTEEASGMAETDRGAVTHLQLLESQAFHTAQHLRQIYVFLRQIGVEPAGELKAEQLAPIRLGEEVF